MPGHAPQASSPFQFRTVIPGHTLRFRRPAAEPLLQAARFMTSPVDNTGPASYGERPLDDLLGALTGEVRPGRAADVTITDIVTVANEVRPGNLFIALPGTAADGHAFIADAARRGAAAIVVERDVGGALDVPLVRVGNTRQALAELAAEWHGRPADRLTLIGITGTAGKTSTLALLEAILDAGGVRVGSVGSLGLRIQGETPDRTVYTTPDPMLLHHGLARLVAAGTRVVVMEATSHALVQDRVHGLRYRIGLFTNLLPLEHSEYHGGFAEYVQAKSRFFDLLEPDAPLVFNRDDPATRALVAKRPDLTAVGVGTDQDSDARIVEGMTTAEGSQFSLAIPRPVPRPNGGTVDEGRLDVQLRLLGKSNRMNAALAATAAMLAGATPDVITRALADFAPPRRRLEVVYKGRFTLLDDTVGHPESINAFFDVVEKLEPPRVHIVYAVRGQRGERINRANGEALAIWVERLGAETLIVTRAADRQDELNRVDDREFDAFVEPLLERDIAMREVERLQPAVHAALESAGEGDVVALLGAQAMDEGQDIARAWLTDEGESPSS